MTEQYLQSDCTEIHPKTTTTEHEEICTRTLQIPTLSMGDLTQHTVTLSAAHYPTASNLQNTHRIQKQQWHYIHINNNNPSLPQESLQHFLLHSCLETRTEDQLHCVSLTTPFRATITVLEVVTPNPLVSKRKDSLFELFCTGQGPWKSVDFYKAQETAGVSQIKGISVHQGLSPSLNGTGTEKPSVFVSSVMEETWRERRISPLISQELGVSRSASVINHKSMI